MSLWGPGAAKEDRLSLDKLWSGSAESLRRLWTVGSTLTVALSLPDLGPC